MENKSNISNSGYEREIVCEIDGEKKYFGARLGAPETCNWTSTDGRYKCGMSIFSATEWIISTSAPLFQVWGSYLQVWADEVTVIGGVMLEDLVKEVIQTLGPTAGNGLSSLFKGVTPRDLSRRLKTALNDKYYELTIKPRFEDHERMMADLPDFGKKYITPPDGDTSVLKDLYFTQYEGSVPSTHLRVRVKKSSVVNRSINELMMWIGTSEKDPFDIRLPKGGSVFMTGKSGQLWYVGSVGDRQFGTTKWISVSTNNGYFEIPLKWEDLGLGTTILHAVPDEVKEKVLALPTYNAHFSGDNDAVKYTMAYLDDLFNSTRSS